MSESAIEDALVNRLDEDRQRNALAFAAFCASSQIELRELVENYWGLYYREEGAGCIGLKDDSWFFVPGMNYSDDWEYYLRNEGLTEAVWANVQPCSACQDCAPGKNMTILGKEFTGICQCVFMFWNPNDTALDCAKKILIKSLQLIAAKKTEVLMQGEKDA